LLIYSISISVTAPYRTWTFLFKNAIVHLNVTFFTHCEMQRYIEKYALKSIVTLNCNEKYTVTPRIPKLGSAEPYLGFRGKIKLIKYILALMKKWKSINVDFLPMIYDSSFINYFFPLKHKNQKCIHQSKDFIELNRNRSFLN
jgi:hypothetical protein